MAHFKQQIKRYKNDYEKRDANRSFKSELKTDIKAVREAVSAGNKEAAVVAYNTAASKLDSSVTKGIHHKNYADRQKSRLSKLVNSIEA